MRASIYTRLGITLLLAGALAAPIFYGVAQSVALTALALSSMLVGAVALLLARSLPDVPPHAAILLLQTGTENIARLLEEIGLGNRAIFLPGRLAGGRPRALIPLREAPDGDPALDGNPVSGDVPGTPTVMRPLPERFIVEYGSGPDEVGILVTTPGTAALGLLDGPPGGGSSELEAALARVLVGGLDVARSVEVSQVDGQVTVRLGGVSLPAQDLWIDRILGTPLAAVAATVVAEGLDRPVMILTEERSGDRLQIHLRAAS